MICMTSQSRARSRANKIRWMSAIAGMAFFLGTGCGPSYEPVPATQCSELAKHSKKLLGARAETRKVMMKKCRAATDELRGCAMAADSAADLLRCSM